jgi:aryl-alcohol dehydrogenase-like predicted oxidoreductase
MEYRQLGGSGLKLSQLSFGSWVTFNKQVDAGLAERMFGTCFDAGINFFDNAKAYEAGQSEIVSVSTSWPKKRICPVGSS